MNKIYAKKIGMSNAYDEKGRRWGVTVLEALPTVISGNRTGDKNGYEALILKIEDDRVARKFILKELRTSEAMEIGSSIKLDGVLAVGDVVQISGKTKGKGFAGVVKRHGFSGGPATHGQSDRERAPGSSGSTTTPGRVYKGKRRAGHMGTNRSTVRGVKVLKIDGDKQQITVIGAVPGFKNRGLIEITKTK